MCKKKKKKPSANVGCCSSSACGLLFVFLLKTAFSNQSVFDIFMASLHQCINRSSCSCLLLDYLFLRSTVGGVNKYIWTLLNYCEVANVEPLIQFELMQIY